MPARAGRAMVASISPSTIHVKLAHIYRYKRITFEWHDYLGATFLRRKDLEPKYQIVGSAREYGQLRQWLKLSAQDREAYRI